MVSFRSSGPLAMGGPLTTHLAGAESNVAIGLSRLGHAAAWVGRVGGDEFGALVLRELRAEGVDVRHAVRDDARQTGLMFLEQRTSGVTRVDYRRAGSAGSALCVDDLRAAVADAPSVLHLTGITPALSEAAAAAVQWAAESCAAAGRFRLPRRQPPGTALVPGGRARRPVRARRNGSARDRLGGRARPRRLRRQRGRRGARRSCAGVCSRSS